VAFRKTLGKLLERISRWTLDDTTARLYGEAFRELRDKGRALSQVDIMLVALTRQMDLTLLTSDRDFEAVPDIRTENWLT
jgi:tRNA(fMet)-specific endonuclease VapC